jgi:hypothetical protein
MLDPVKTAAEHEQRDPQRRYRDACIPAHSRQLEACGDAGELCGRRSEIRDQKRAHDDGGRWAPIALSHERHQAPPRHKAHSRSELVEDNQRAGREDDDPQELVAEARTEDRVRRDACRVVVRESGEETRSEHGEKGREAERSGSGSQERAPVPPAQSLYQDGKHGLLSACGSCDVPRV